MSEANELEILRAKKAELENESRTLTEIQRSIENNVKMLEEQVAIKELQKKNKALRETVNQLKYKKAQLENKLKEKKHVQDNSTPGEKNPSERKHHSRSPPSKEDNETSEVTVPENLEDLVTLEGIDPKTILENEEISENPQKPEEKKKRRFF
jgi:hypothetical protein